jgi:hypothetical protein
MHPVPFIISFVVELSGEVFFEMIRTVINLLSGLAKF